MTISIIQFIDHPPYHVDFSQYSKSLPVAPPSLGVQKVAKLVLVSIVKAGYVTLSHLNASFKHIVLGYYGSWKIWIPPKDIYLVVFKIVVWLAAIGWCFVTTTTRLIYQDIKSKTPSNWLLSFAPKELDPSHIRTRNFEIDMSDVPDDVCVSELCPMFNEIKFDTISALSRTEDGIKYEKEALEKGLKTFVTNVNGRIPLIGTPPRGDTPALFEFYQNIEDAVRFVIHKSKQGLIPQQEIVFRLAIAGMHCGTRYLGEAMELYNMAKGEDPLIVGSLQEALIEILAKKRKEIALQHIPRYLGTDTHAYANYFSSFGSTLALPGTAHIVEFLSAPLNPADFLPRFFEEYTVNYIITTIQGQVTTSQPLREKIIDWLKAQRGDWQSPTIPPLENLVTQATTILTDMKLDKTFHLYQNLNNLNGLINHAITHPAVQNPGVWTPEGFVASYPNWFKTHFPEQPLQMSVKNNIQDLFDSNQFGEDLITAVKTAIENKNPLNIESFHTRLLQLQQASALHKHTHLNADTAMRVVENKKSLKEAIQEQRDQLQDNEFLLHLKIDDIHQNGLSKEMMEWLLVSQGILLPQV